MGVFDGIPKDAVSFSFFRWDGREECLFLDRGHWHLAWRLFGGDATVLADDDNPVSEAEARAWLLRYGPHEALMNPILFPPLAPHTVAFTTNPVPEAPALMNRAILRT
jgi:hypothetical protein